MPTKATTITSLVCLLVLTGAGVTALAQSTPTITIDATAPRRAVSPEMYGIFFEEISRAGDGGLCAELIQNRDFEATNLPADWRQEGRDIYTAKGRHYNQWWDTPTPGWSLVAEGGAEGSISLETDTPLNDRNPHSLKLTVTEMGDRCGVANSGFWGMNVEEGQWYDATFCAHGDRSVGLVFSLEAEDGTVCARATIPEVGGGMRGRGGASAQASPWRKYQLSLQAHASNPKCRLVIEPIEPATMWFDVVSLYPRETFKGHGLRKDLCEMLAALEPGFMRFPGGCVVEGASFTSRWNWRESIGDISQRRGLYNVWGYFNTYGLGYHELLQLSEDLGTEAMYVCNVGMSCSARQPSESVQGDELQPFVQDALEALEYALGPVTSTWGAQRAANGHPEPFNLKYIEIGNENGGPVYQANYRVFYDAIKARYPNVITIADQRVPGAPVEIVDEHFYVNPARFFGMATHYDDTDRRGPKIYVGEYAVNSGVGDGNLMGALAESVFMMNMEKNADVVRMCSYAPLFENVNSREWPVNLIRFDNSQVMGRTSYYVQKLFGTQRPDVVLTTIVEAASVSPASLASGERGGRGGRGGGQPAQINQLYALAGLDQKTGELIIKVTNPTAEPVTGRITLKGLTGLGRTAKVITLGHTDATAENTLENPDVVVPTQSQMAVSGSEFSATFAPNSLTILRLPARG